ncbi:enoyl-[acyl-carrier-protein] reductase FabK [Frisingicoccus sp.]|uniref:enoyl-[acyl-carrier-protein] reductase FabK n=1 Tax=Frisingicoccus sp. TaxID=1918627 RepID=UPI003AB85D2C
MKTAITELLHIEYPIFQGGMAWVAEHTLAAAVSNAGGLGIIASGGAPCEYIQEEVHKAKQLTDKPFGVNVMLMNPEAEAIAKMLVEEQVSVVTTGAGNPEKYFPMWKEAGIKIIPVVASVGLARRMAKYGADALIAEGCESGGHIGEQTTMSLVPQVVQAVDIPVLAAGGIGDGRGVAAAFMLGAEGVQVGTRFLLADETRIHENYKEKVAKAKDIDTQVTGRSTGHPVRLLRNPMTRKYLKLEAEGASAETLELLTLGSLRRAVVDGDLEEGSFMAGQIAGLVNKRQTCREIIEEMMDEALTVMLAKADRFK